MDFCPCYRIEDKALGVDIWNGEGTGGNKPGAVKRETDILVLFDDGDAVACQGAPSAHGTANRTTACNKNIILFHLCKELSKAL